jgi:hypothetical protein
VGTVFRWQYVKTIDSKMSFVHLDRQDWPTAAAESGGGINGLL